MSSNYLKCPNCGAEIFYAEDRRGNLYFFHVDPERNPISTKTPPQDLEGLSLEKVYCVSCAWFGGVEQLVEG